MVPVVEGERLRTLSTNVKEQAQFFPQGYLDSPVLKDVLDPEKVKADWMANSWHLGVAEFLLKLVLEGGLRNQIKTGRGEGTRWLPQVDFTLGGIQARPNPFVGASFWRAV